MEKEYRGYVTQYKHINFGWIIELGSSKSLYADNEVYTHIGKTYNVVCFKFGISKKKVLEKLGKWAEKNSNDSEGEKL